MTSTLTLRSKVIDAARELDLLTVAGDLQFIDSMRMIQLVVVLEEVIGAAIPTAQLTPETFESIDSLVRVLAPLTPAR